ncbi:hypothetical protein [Pseudomonas fontis]|uniref:Uncharacterized protein n=1 Tax=Pseudomonas fontis TaxID=2942633 RepID=A0ABT5P135_9PSED|nr:hypothetical protein [Pseudomonas fontis]MDD0977510.1 hypothetical protein [Pseudomonas fontis]MDD0994056.1 hypothetical protein [Pseudomonas fontis]
MQAANSQADHATSLILNQRTSKVCDDEPVLFQESRLVLSSDLQRVLLVRYIEQYSPAGSQWVEYFHSVPVAAFNQWIMANGELHIEHSEGPASPL